MLRLLLIALLATTSAHASESGQPISIVDMTPAAPLTEGRAVSTAPFGGKFAGRALWLSANGRYAALLRITEDTNANGRLDIFFSMHGEPSGDALALDLFDVDSGTHQRFDDLLSVDRWGRFAVLSRGADTFLFDANDGSAKNLSDMGGGASADANRCMAPRQISFDARGENLLLLRDHPAEIVLRSIATGESRVLYRPENPVWRAGFAADLGWLVTTEVNGDFPQQITSCDSNSHKAFAASWSNSGFKAEQLSYSVINHEGSRRVVSDAPVLLSRTAYALPTRRQIRRFDNETVEIPAGCELADEAEGARVVVIQCGATHELLDPVSGERRSLPPGQSLRFIDGARTAGTAGTWYAVRLPEIEDLGAKEYAAPVGRLRVEDLRLERLPGSGSYMHPSNPEWLVAFTKGGYLYMNLASGTFLQVQAKDRERGAFTLRTGSRSYLLLDPDHRRLAKYRGQPGISNDHGCFLPARSMREAGYAYVDLGPWTRTCVEAL